MSTRTTSARRFTGQYAADGKAKRLRVREEAGHRCIRCQHPFESGKHGKGEWSPCDAQCLHKGPIRALVRGVWIVADRDRMTAGALVRNDEVIEAQWRILTVHHANGDKGDDWWANTLALCQRCHLQIQGKVDPHIPWMLEHSTWFKPYAAAFYAKKYLGLTLTRDEVMQRLDELLALECRV